MEPRAKGLHGEIDEAPHDRGDEAPGGNHDLDGHARGLEGAEETLVKTRSRPATDAGKNARLPCRCNPLKTRADAAD